MNRRRIRRITSTLVIVCMVASIAGPGLARAATASDDLKQIEYTYYFRGKYQQAIEALQTFLARTDVSGPDATHAREFLAASYVLGGAPAMGKEVFLQIIKASPEYGGPDPAVFKLAVVNTYAEARSDYAAMALKNAPAGSKPAANGSDGAAPAEEKGKPIYKKWWFYAGAAAALVIAGVAAGGGGGGAPAGDAGSGSVAVGVTVR
jgi:hypothetical protein